MPSNTEKLHLLKEGTEDKTARKEGGELYSCQGWVVLLGIAGIKYLKMGLIGAIPILFVEFLDKFNEPRAITSLLIAIQMAAFLMYGVLSGMVITIFGYRTNIAIGTIMTSCELFLTSFMPSILYVAITFGLLGGIGCSFLLTASDTGSLMLFTVHRELATSIAQSVSGIALATFPILTSYLLNIYALYGTLWILSAIMLHGLVFLLFFPSHQNKVTEDYKSPPERIQEQLKGIKDASRRRLFWLVFLAYLAYELSADGSRGFLADRGRLWGLTDRQIVIVVSLWGITATLSRLITGPTVKTPVVRIVSLSFFYFTWGVILVLSMYMNKFWSMATYSGLCGALNGIVGVLLMLIVSDTTPDHQIALTFGFLVTLLGIVYLVAIPLSGKIYDVTRSYDIVFCAYGGLAFLAAVLSIFILILYKRKEKDRNDNSLT